MSNIILTHKFYHYTTFSKVPLIIKNLIINFCSPPKRKDIFLSHKKNNTTNFSTKSSPPQMPPKVNLSYRNFRCHLSELKTKKKKIDLRKKKIPTTPKKTLTESRGKKNRKSLFRVLLMIGFWAKPEQSSLFHNWCRYFNFHIASTKFLFLLQLITQLPFRAALYHNTYTRIQFSLFFSVRRGGRRATTLIFEGPFCLAKEHDYEQKRLQKFSIWTPKLPVMCTGMFPSFIFLLFSPLFVISCSKRWNIKKRIYILRERCWRKFTIHPQLSGNE